VNLATERATATADPSVTVAQIFGAVEAATTGGSSPTKVRNPAQQVGAVARRSSVAMIGLLLLVVPPCQRP
jgi:hypothetical protein